MVERTPSSIVRDFQTVADATYLSTKSRIDAGEEGLELPLAVAMGMSHQARQILEAINTRATSTLQAQCERQRVAEWRFDVPDADSRRARHIVLVTGSKWHSDMPWYREAVGVAATVYEGRQGYKPEDIAEIEQRYGFDAGTGKVVAWMDFVAPDLPQDSHKLVALPMPHRALRLLREGKIVVEELHAQMERLEKLAFVREYFGWLPEDQVTVERNELRLDDYQSGQGNHSYLEELKLWEVQPGEGARMREALLMLPDLLRELHEQEAARYTATSTLQAQCERQRVALERLVYETTHLSPCKPNGDHDCTISAGTLAFARTVLTLADHASLDGEKS